MNRNNPIILDVSYLNWPSPPGYDEMEDELELYHDCMAWCDDNNMNVVFVHEVHEINWDDGLFDPVIERPQVTAAFQTQEDAAMFRLRWS